MAKHLNKNKFYKIKYCIHGPFGYWWQNRKLIPWEEVNTHKRFSTHRWFTTAKLAFKALKNTPHNSMLTRFIRQSKQGYNVKNWIK